MAELESLASKNLERDLVLSDALSDYKKRFMSIADGFEAVKVHLESMQRMVSGEAVRKDQKSNGRRQFSDIVKSNNSKFLRTNAIETRRVAERSEKESAVVQQLAKQSALDAKEMKRLAYLTMAFLPTTTVAVSAE